MTTTACKSDGTGSPKVSSSEFVRRFVLELERTEHERWEVLTKDGGAGGDFVHYRRGTLWERIRVAWSRASNGESSRRDQKPR